MGRLQIGRRVLLGAFALTLALPALRAAAAVEGPMDFGSREDFEDYCENVGGTFTDTGDGNLWCQDFTGGQTVCDTNGNDCYTFYKPPKAGDPLAPISDPVIALPADTGGSEPPPPVTDNPTATDGQQSVTAPDSGQDQDHKTNKKGKHGKKGKKGGKHRRR
jgi:hypothetical protein